MQRIQGHFQWVSLFFFIWKMVGMIQMATNSLSKHTKTTAITAVI